jgi:hypothetical protein
MLCSRYGGVIKDIGFANHSQICTKRLYGYAVS